MSPISVYAPNEHLSMPEIPHLEWVHAISMLFLGMAFFALVIQLLVIKKTEKTFCRAQELFINDHWIFLALAFLSVCTFVSYISWTATITLYEWRFGIAGIWGTMLIISFFVLMAMIRRLYRFTDVLFLFGIVKKRFAKSLKKDDEQQAMQWIDVELETIFKSGMQGGIATVNRGVQALYDLLNNYVQIMALHEVLASKNSTPESVFDRFNFLCVYICKKLEWIFQALLKAGIDPIAEEILASFGKLALFCLKQHPSLGQIPFSFITKCSQFAFKRGDQEIVVRGIVTLSEACKMCIEFSKEKGISYKSSIVSIILDIESLVKAQYQQQEANVPLLMQPFAEIGEVLGSPEYANILDRDAILKELKRLLAEFQALEVVLQNVGP